MQKYIIICGLILATVAVPIVFAQSCTTILKNKQLYLQNNFNLTKYAGVWYEVRRNKTSLLERGDCNRSNYTVINGTKERINGSLLAAWNNYQVKTQQSGILNITQAGDTTGNLTFVNATNKNETNHWILKTNYNYSVVYSCVDIAQKGEENIVILSRNKTINAEYITEALNELMRYDTKEPALIITNQTKQCDSLMGGAGVTAVGPKGIVVVMHVLALTVLTKLLQS